MDKNLFEWLQICKKFCHDRRFTLLFVNSSDFGYEDEDGGLHHVYAEELLDLLKQK